MNAAILQSLEREDKRHNLTHALISFMLRRSMNAPNHLGIALMWPGSPGPIKAGRPCAITGMPQS
jgi:hypothetical protein